MNMQKRNWGSLEGIVDVGIVVIAHVTNPARDEAINFLKRVFVGEINAIIPTSAFLGGYHILTRYLKVPRLDAKQSLMATLKVNAPVFYEDIKIEHVMDSLEYAAVYNIESWDGYLISLAKDFDAHTIFTIDRDFRKIPGLLIINPISNNAMKAYHNWLSTQHKQKIE